MAHRVYVDKNPRRKWGYELKKCHGITVAEYEEIWNAQGGVCAICSNPQRGSRVKRLVVDHDHKTGIRRGLLCDKCNRGIGLLLDDPEVLMAAVAYLMKFQSTPVQPVLT